MATTERRNVSYWQQGVDDARSGFRPDLAGLPLTDNVHTNTAVRSGYSNGYCYGMANPTPKNNESAK